MAERIGIWMDHHEALIVRLPDGAGGDEARVETIESDLEPRHRPAGGGRPPEARHGFGAGQSTHQSNRREQVLDRFYDDVQAAVAEADAVALIGPGLARKEFERRYTDGPDAEHRAPVIASESCDRLTRPQVVERVGRIFGHEPPRR